MFGNHSLEVQLVKKPRDRKDDTPPSDNLCVDLERAGIKATMIQQSAETVAKVVVTTYALKKLIDTVCEIAVIAAKSKL